MAIKKAYLTIDDSPSAHMRPKIDFLLHKGIPAIFFCEGRKIDERPEAVIYAIQNGFIIGNHSYNHPQFSAISLAEAFEEIQRTDALIDTIYQQANVTRPAKYFRFPYGDKGGLVGEYPTSGYGEEGTKRKNIIQDHLRQLGYQQPAFTNITTTYYREAGLLDEADWFWTFDTFDWSVNSAEPMYGITSLEAVYARIDEDEPEGARGLNRPESEEIVLIHDHDDSTDIFYPIVERLQEKGLQFSLPAELAG
ncbi:MAG: polysaccharide deacetylase family protein [Anaerolineae bacterium]|nr:polysaccharide deacetylase family protein [Anaerolineae bacterium]